MCILPPIQNCKILSLVSFTSKEGQLFINYLVIITQLQILQQCYSFPSLFFLSLEKSPVITRCLLAQAVYFISLMTRKQSFIAHDTHKVTLCLCMRSEKDSINQYNAAKHTRENECRWSNSTFILSIKFSSKYLLTSLFIFPSS